MPLTMQRKAVKMEPLAVGLPWAEEDRPESWPTGCHSTQTAWIIES